MARGSRLAEINFDVATVDPPVFNDRFDDLEPGWIAEGEEDIGEGDATQDVLQRASTAPGLGNLFTNS